MRNARNHIQIDMRIYDSITHTLTATDPKRRGSFHFGVYIIGAHTIPRHRFWILRRTQSGACTRGATFWGLRFIGGGYSLGASSLQLHNTHAHVR